MEKNAETDTADAEKDGHIGVADSVGAVGVRRVYKDGKAALAPGVHRACQAYLCPQVW